MRAFFLLLTLTTLLTCPAIAEYRSSYLPDCGIYELTAQVRCEEPKNCYLDLYPRSIAHTPILIAHGYRFLKGHSGKYVRTRVRILSQEKTHLSAVLLQQKVSVTDPDVTNSAVQKQHTEACRL